MTQTHAISLLFSALVHAVSLNQMSRHFSSPARLLLLSLSPKFFLSIIPSSITCCKQYSHKHPSQRRSSGPPAPCSHCVRCIDSSWSFITYAGCSLWTELAWGSRPSALVLSHQSSTALYHLLLDIYPQSVYGQS